VARCTRAGLEVTAHRVVDLDHACREEIRSCAERWRDGAVERGFTMALGRLCSEEDVDSVVVLARDPEGQLQGMLSLVPWGPDGLSLDVMRRDRDTENGVVEYMVAALCTVCPHLGVRRISLNFAVLRYVFARGEQLGAGPVLRLWRTVLLGLSRFWQIESLYRANAKYRPEWHPRFLCFERAGDLAVVGTAALRAEAFLVAPRWVSRLRQR
jgi:lysyl-tRNA synthetase class 2